MIRSFPPQSIPVYAVEIDGRRTGFEFTSLPAAERHARLVGGEVVTITPYVATEA